MWAWGVNVDVNVGDILINYLFIIIYYYLLLISY